MAEGPSREEFDRAIERLYDAVDKGFSGIHGRLDVLNGRTRKLETDGAVREVKLTEMKGQLDVLPCVAGTLQCQQPAKAPGASAGRQASYVGIALVIFAVMWEALQFVSGKLIVVLEALAVELRKL